MFAFSPIHSGQSWGGGFIRNVEPPTCILHTILLRCFFTQWLSLATLPQGRQSWGLGVATRRPPDFGQGGREILYMYLIMHRKYVRKWWLLKRNRIILICPEVAVNGQFLSGKSKFYLKLPEKNRNFSEICLENQTFLESAWKNRILKFLGNLPGKIEFYFDPDPWPPDFKPDWRRCTPCTPLSSSALTIICIGWIVKSQIKLSSGYGNSLQPEENMGREPEITVFLGDIIMLMKAIMMRFILLVEPGDRRKGSTWSVL